MTEVDISALPDAEASGTNSLERWRSILLERCSTLAYTGSVLELVERDLRLGGYAGPPDAALLIYLAATSRLLDQPVSVAVLGPSSAGKSFAIKSALQFIPPGAFVEVTAMSDKALIYWDQELKHRMLVIYEGAGVTGDFFAYAVRSLLSEGRLEYVVTDIETRSAIRISREGPTGLITSTTGSIERELATRLFTPSITDTPELTRAILDAEARAAAGLKESVDYSVHHDLQRLAATATPEVVVPFAPRLSAEVDPTAVRLRRDFRAVLGLVKAHALLHREVRDVDGAGRLVASYLDYDVVFGLVSSIVAEAAERTIPETVRETVDAVRSLSIKKGGPDEEVTIAQLAKHLGLSRPAVTRRVNRALGLGFLADHSGGGRGKQRRLMTGDPMSEDSGVLPAPEVLA